MSETILIAKEPLFVGNTCIANTGSMVSDEFYKLYGNDENKWADKVEKVTLPNGTNDSAKTEVVTPKVTATKVDK